MKFLIFTCLAVAIFASVENERLMRVNKVLAKTLREMTVDKETETEVSDVLAMFYISGGNVDTVQYEIPEVQEIPKLQGRSANSAAAEPEARGTEDYYCIEGIPAPGVCCHSSCGTCGGYGCDLRPGGDYYCCMQTINANGRNCNSPTDVACIVPNRDQCWTLSTDGRELAGIGTTADAPFYVYHALEYFDCVELANAVDAEGGTYYFSYTEAVYNGFCKILKPETTHPDISQTTAYDYYLYVNTCQPSIALVNKDSSEVYGAFDWGSGFTADSINDPFGQDAQRLYTGLDPFMQWAGILEGSVIPKVGIWYAAGVQYVLCEENVSFTGGLKRYIFSVNGGVAQCIPEES